MRALLALTLLPLALLAGCSDAPGSDPASPAEHPAAEASSPASPAGLEPAALATRWEPLALRGQTQVGACMGVASQTGTCQAMGGTGTFVMLGYGQDLVRVAGNLTWTATTPATEDLFIMVLACSDLEGSQCENHGEYPFASGPSPLGIDWDLANQTDQPLALWVVHYLGDGAYGSYATTMAPQAFAFDGAVEKLA